MFSRAALFALLFASADAATSSNQELKSKLLRNARSLNEERDISWMPNYSIKFEKCHSLIQVAGEQGGGGDGESMLYTQNLVEFSLCPSDSCSENSCKNGGTYITNMQEFVEAYTQYKEELKEQACEAVRENCNNDDENYCFAMAGMNECIEVEGEEEDDIERFMQCEALDVDNDNNNNNNWNYYNNYQNNANYYLEYFVGPICTNGGKSINLAVFVDEGCSVQAESGVYEQVTYGKTLPYSSESIVGHDCISCERVDEDANNNNNNNNNQNNNNNNNNQNNNNNNNQQQEVEILEMCEEMYENAGKCESSLAAANGYGDETACSFITDVLPKMEGVTRSLGGASDQTTTILAWVFGVCAVFLGIYSFLLYRRLRRSKVALNESSGPMA